MEGGTASDSGKIYRNSNGMFYYACVHCGIYFMNIDTILHHIDRHFSDGTIAAEQIPENEDKAMESVKFLDFDENLTESPEFISIATENLKIERDIDRDDGCTENWLEENCIENSKDFINQQVENEKNIRCVYCNESFVNQLFLGLHSDEHHPNKQIEGVRTHEVTSDLGQDTFKCDICTMEFDTNVKLEGHCAECHNELELTIDLKVDSLGSLDHSEENLECKLCRRNFKAKHLLKRHLQRSTCKDEFCIPLQVGEFPFYCDICNHGFHYKFRLIHHMTQRHTGKPSKCKYCNQRYVLETSLKKHETKECPLRPGTKEDDTKKVTTKRALSFGPRNIANKNWGGYRQPKNVEGPKMFNCEFCDKIYDTHYKLKQHLLSHANLREFKCDLCDCAYNTKPRLRRHYIYNHTNHPTFDCEVCGWKFREKNNLKRHMRLHNGDYQAQCHVCNKKFTANCHLKYHMMTAHSSETPYQCDLCGKSFNSTSKMNAHRRRHIKETLPCDICGKIFGSKNRLYTHKKTHSEERNIICKECGKTFKTAVVLRQHMYLHKGKIFSCNFCPMTFAQSSGRRTHEKLRHNIL